ncbi:MCE family protein [bacterium]|nr:MCE family protein [bacterium]
MAENAQYTIPKKLSTEFFVGIFVLMGLLAFGYLAINLARIKLFDRGYYHVTAVFGSVAGLQTGAPVEIAGVGIGDVEKINLAANEALVTLKIKDTVTLTAEDVAEIRTKGIIGDRYIMIIPGLGETIKNGGKITQTTPPVELEDVVKKFVSKVE